MEQLQTGQLFIVATPIGNLSDISARAIDVLQQVDLIAAEDTRHSKSLLQHFGINTPTVSLHEHNEQQRSELLLKRLKEGESVALISDAGTPLISDPGYRLVSLVKQNNIRVTPVPGCSAVITALCVSGIATDQFSFHGFLPVKAGAKKQLLETLKNESSTLIFYESPRRLLDTLKQCVSVFGEQRLACVARELTKLHETINTQSLAALSEWVEQDPNQQRGESVLIISGAEQAATVEQVELERILNLLIDELPVKKVAAIAAEITGCRKNDAYQLALTLKQK